MTDILYDLESKIREWFSGKFKSLGLLPSETPEAKPPEPEKIVSPQEPQPTPTTPTQTYPPSSPKDATTGTYTQASNTPNVAPAPEPMPEFIPAPTPAPAPTSTYLEACEANCHAEQDATVKWLTDHRIGNITHTCSAGKDCISEEAFQKGMDDAFNKAIACRDECRRKYSGA